MSEQPGRGEEPGTPGVAWTSRGTPVAHVPGRVLVRGAAAVEHLRVLLPGRDVPVRVLAGREEAGDAVQYALAEGLEDPLAVVAALRADGFEAQPDHVLFAHDASGGLWGNPHVGNPHVGNPHVGNPHVGNPHVGNPHVGNPHVSSAVPATGRSFPPRTLDGPGAHPRVTILDTGLATRQDAGGTQRDWCPLLLNDPQQPDRISGAPDTPDAALTPDPTGATTPEDGWLDPVAGHGTFIAGLVEQLAPGCAIRVGRVLSPLGIGVESDCYEAILAEAALAPGDRPDLLSLSFGGTVLLEAPALRSAVALAGVAGITVVASAGNNGTSVPQFPAAYPDVVAVGAVGPDGPPPWSNWGDWVDACAPGVELVSAFFADFDGPAPEVNTYDADRFGGWAAWSGTSFSVGVVVAALAREMVLGSCSAKEAVARVVHAPEALRLPGLGTVVSP